MRWVPSRDWKRYLSMLRYRRTRVVCTASSASFLAAPKHPQGDAQQRLLMLAVDALEQITSLAGEDRLAPVLRWVGQRSLFGVLTSTASWTDIRV